MPNSTVPAADEGLPNLNLASGLVETERGLAVIRARSAKNIRPTLLPAEELALFHSKLDEYVSASQLEDYFSLKHREAGYGDNEFKISLDDARSKLRAIRRNMIKLLRHIREAKSKTLEDLLFKALISEIIEPYEIRKSQHIAHSIANDLLSSDCQWRA